MAGETAPSDGEEEFIWTAERDAGVAERGRFPADALLDPPAPLSFTRVLAALVLVGGAIDAVLVGSPPTGIPYNYPAAGAVLYGLLAVWVLRRTSAALELIGRDLASIARRTAADAALRPREIDADAITREVETLRRRAFHPAVLLGGAAIGAGIAVWAVSRLGLANAYPYPIANATYGAAHGLLVGPAVATVVLGARIADRYAVGLDVLAPDGAGGYRRIGRALAAVVTDGIALVTLDLVVLASVGAVRASLLTAVLAGYGLSLAILLGFAVAGTVAIRWRLRRVRDETAAAMRARFDDAAARFWATAGRDDGSRPAADAIRTMGTLSDRLGRTSPWPLCRWSVARLIAALGLSLAVARTLLVVVAGWT